VEQDCDLIGLSGLITPSLDEMVHVAREMERRGIDKPLLIGGATTSKQHTAVKIAPQLEGSTVHVHDASRAVGVVSSLLDSKQRKAFDEANQHEQERLRYVYTGREKRPLLAWPDATANRLELDWHQEGLPEPAFTGVRVVDDISLDEIASYIDWTFFFAAWELKGKFPKILEHPKYGEAAREIYEAGQTLLRRILDEKLLQHTGLYGFWPAAREGEDVVLYADDQRSRVQARFPMLRQQGVQPDGKPNRSLADYLAPSESGLRDHLGAFAVTTGIGADELAADFERALDDYSAIMVKALADRLAEAYAECLHQRARRDWGYGADEGLSKEELIAEGYRGIRPAFGYPACPDHTDKRVLFELLGAAQHGIELTESCAMTPAASVSGLYFAHPAARYFTVGRIDRDQVEDYAARKQMSVAEIERWIQPNLGYDPDA
jgi:5-methyltetrahydrofolate--homocysteine methyltransferase